MKKKKLKKPNSKATAGILLAVGSILIIALIVFLAVSQPTVPDATKIRRVSASEANKAVSSGQAILLDVRSEASYQNLHAAGAINIPLEELESRFQELDPETWIITYCT